MKKILVLGLCCGLSAAAYADSSALSSGKAASRDLSASTTVRARVVDSSLAAKEAAPVAKWAGNASDRELLSPVQQQILELKEAGRSVPAELYQLAQDEAGYVPVQHDGNSRQGGEDIASAMAIPSLPFSDTGTTVGYANDYDFACPYTGSTSPDVVYSYIPASAQTINIDLCLSSYDTKLYVYLNDALSDPIACNDDFYFALPCYTFSSAIEGLNVTAGNTYYIVVDGYGGSSGAYQIDVTSLDCQPVECVGTPEVEPNDGPNGDPIVFGTIDCGETVCGTTFTYNDGVDDLRDTDWYELLLLNDAIVTIDLDVSTFDGLAFLLAGDAATILYTGNNGGACEDEQIVTDCLPAGNYYVFAGPTVFTGIDDPVEYGLTVSCETCTYVSPCEDAVAMVCPGSYAGDTSDDLNYVGNAGPDNFFFIENTVPGNITTFSLCGGATWDTYLRLFDMCPTDPGAVELAYNDDFCGLQSELTYTLDVATYWLVVEGFGSNSGVYTLTTSCTTVGPCDEYAPTAISLPYAGSGTNVGAPDVWGAGQGGSAAGDVGYTFTMPANSSLTFASCLPGTDFDSDTYVISGDPCDGGVEVFYNDGDSACEFASFASGWTIPCGSLPAGDYTLLVSGYSSAEGNFEFTLEATECICDPINCVGDAEVEPNDGPNGDPVVYGSIACGGTVCGTTFTDSVGGTRDTDWYEITLVEDMALTVDLDVEAFDALMFVIAGDAATILATADNAGWCEDEQIVTDCLQAGTYYVWVGPNGFDGVDEGANYGLTVACEPCVWVDPYTACQTVSPIDGNWSFGVSEADWQGGYIVRYERFGHVVGTITGVDFVGLTLYNDGAAWSACAEDPMPFNIGFFANDGGMPGTLIDEFTLELSGTPTGDLYAGVYESSLFSATLPNAVAMEDGFISIVGAGANDCWFLWGSSETGADLASLVDNNGVLGAEAYDLNYCFATELVCDTPSNVGISVSGGNAHLTWDAAPGATSYTIYSALNGYGTYTMLGTSATTTYTDLGATAAGRRNYKIVANCD